SDAFELPDGRTTNGTDESGRPLYGYGDYLDADRRGDGGGGSKDGIFMEPLLSDSRVPNIAKQWVLAEELNTKVSSNVVAGVARHIPYLGTTTLATAIANTASHEIAHAFGVLEAYLDVPRPFLGPRGTAGVRKDSNAIPYDLMRRGDPRDGDLNFAQGNISIL